jgi:6-pyruvoyltetrahydropterin/6-carboxytetrahydropterin synthase
MHFLRLANDQLVFSAGHFITLADGVCESVHGHDYRVVLELWGELGPHQYLLDYVALEEMVRAILAGWDHKMLLPTEHPQIRVVSGPGEVEVRFAERRWVFPPGDCRLLAVGNTTTEQLAEQLTLRIVGELVARFRYHPDRLKVEIAEGAGRSAGFEWRSTGSRS